MAHTMNNLIRHNGVFVAGYSHHAKKVYYTKDVDNAMRFKAGEANEFMDIHNDVGHCFRTVNATVISETEVQHGTG